MAGDLSLAHFGWLSLSGMAVVAAPGTPLWLLPALGFVGHIVYDVSPELQSQVRPLLGAASDRARAALPPPVRRFLPMTSAGAIGQGAWENTGLDDIDPLGPETDGDEPLASLPPISLAELAAAPNILIVGSPGSGKTTLLHALIAARPWRCYVLDPHAHPQKWPVPASVIGGGRNFPSIYAALQRAEAALTSRARRLHADAHARFAPFSLAGDEWGSVCSEIVVDRDEDPPGRMLIRLLKEGRKFGISFIGAAHNDTAASLGTAGDTQAFRYAFDWILYMGGFVGRELKDLPALARALPTGRTPEGKVFPLIVVARSPVTGERRLLDLRGIGTALTEVHAHVRPDPERAKPLVADPEEVRTDDRTDKPQHQVAMEPPTPAPNERTNASPALRDRDDLVRLLVQQGWKTTQIREVVKGTNTEIGDLVRRIEDELADERRA